MSKAVKNELTESKATAENFIEDMINSPTFYATLVVAGIFGFMATYYSKKKISRRQLRKARQFTTPISRMLNDLYSDEEDLGHC